MRALVLVILLFIGFSDAVAAREVIRNFVSDVVVNRDGSLDVTETITVNAEGNQIRRGILRDFPTDYPARDGSRVRVSFEVVGVERDGHGEPYTTESIANGVRIKIGDADVFLDYGEHTYRIRYHTTRQLGFFGTYDELYWNVTGNGWTFPIERAEAIVRLPNGASVGQHSVYTGSYGESERGARVTRADGNLFAAETSRALDIGEGLTIAVAWQKGIVAAPTEAEKRVWWIMDNLGVFGMVATLLGVAFYYYFAWTKVGRDPPKGIVVPLFTPPQGLGPAGVRYVWKQGYDHQAFAAALVGLAVKGRLKIEDKDGDYTIAKLPGQGPALTSSEAALAKALPAQPLHLVQSNHASVGGARSALESALDDEYDGTMFVKNFTWFAVGAVLSAVGMLASGFFTPTGEGAVVAFTAVFMSVWWGVVLTIAWSVVKGAIAGRGFLTKIKSLMAMIFLLPFFGAGITVPSFIWFLESPSPTTLFFIAAVVLLALFNLIFYWLLKAPTVKGRAVMDQIEGFRMYMTTAEEERLKVLHPPEKTPELFERYLPYAMALDCENEWNAKFAAILAAAAAAGAASSPSWYGGSNWNSGSFSRDLSSGLTSSISSSATAPGSSSGSGGGGSSGGGGGGGGGSGW